MKTDMPQSAGAGELALGRAARIFSGRPGLSRSLGREARVVPLAANQIFRPEPGLEVVIRLGRLRISEFLPDGREVCRAVLQAGSYLVARSTAEPESNDSAPGPERRNVFPLDRMLVMALGRTDLWVLPAGTLRRHDV